MKRAMEFLIQVDNVVFDNWYAQGIMLIIWIMALVSSIALFWLSFGLLVYAVLVGVNFYRRGQKETDEIKALYKKEGIFPFVKGLNYCLLLGPLGFALAVLMKVSSSKKD